jgi:hypothetical protein
MRRLCVVRSEGDPQTAASIKLPIEKRIGIVAPVHLLTQLVFMTRIPRINFEQERVVLEEAHPDMIGTILSPEALWAQFYPPGRNTLMKLGPHNL